MFALQQAVEEPLQALPCLKLLKLDRHIRAEQGENHLDVRPENR